MSWDVGTAFRETEYGHLCFVVAVDGDWRAVVSLASYTTNVRGDDSCILEKGEHPFITHRTYVNYRMAARYKISQLDDRLAHRSISAYPHPADEILLKKMLEGALKSQYIEARIHRMLEKQLNSMDA